MHVQHNSSQSFARWPNHMRAATMLLCAVSTCKSFPAGTPWAHFSWTLRLPRTAGCTQGFRALSEAQMAQHALTLKQRHKNSMAATTVLHTEPTTATNHHSHQQSVLIMCVDQLSAASTSATKRCTAGSAGISSVHVEPTFETQRLDLQPA